MIRSESWVNPRNCSIEMVKLTKCETQIRRTFYKNEFKQGKSAWYYMCSRSSLKRAGNYHIYEDIWMNKTGIYVWFKTTLAFSRSKYDTHANACCSFCNEICNVWMSHLNWHYCFKLHIICSMLCHVNGFFVLLLKASSTHTVLRKDTIVDDHICFACYKFQIVLCVCVYFVWSNFHVKFQIISHWRTCSRRCGRVKRGHFLWNKPFQMNAQIRDTCSNKKSKNNQRPFNRIHSGVHDTLTFINLVPSLRFFCYIVWWHLFTKRLLIIASLQCKNKTSNKQTGTEIQ